MMNRFLILSLASLMFTGCQHARSFLHMDSNSSSPFMGLELSVDASDRLPASTREYSVKTASVVATEFETERAVPASLSIESDHELTNEGFVATSETRENTGSLKYSLPTVELNDGSTDADEIDAIISRFPGS